jgi:DNA-binding MarR family transcriptional regulator
VREDSQELSIEGCLESLGICLFSEWDVLAFLYHHKVSLTTADRIARLIGYESTAVSDALDRLERERLIERSRALQGVRLYRMLIQTDDRRQRCLRQLVSLSENRAGRLLLAKRLKPVRSESGEENNRLNL